jgi:ABC-2 type transport system ATP-binding protein
MADVKRMHGTEYVAIRVEQPSADMVSDLRRSPSVREIREQGTEIEVALRAGADPQQLLQQLLRSGVRLRRFEVTEPSLEQVFIERVGAGAVVEEELIGV